MTTLDTLTDAETCGRCGTVFASLAEVFSHVCPSSRYVTVPNGFGGTTTVKREAPYVPAGHVKRANRYPGTCATCGDHVASEAGGLVKLAGSWLTHCASCPAPTSAPAAPTSPAPAHPDAPAGGRSNRYAGTCGTCGGEVPADTGRLVNAAGKWRVFHVGPCPEKVAPTGPTLPDVPAGRYAVENADGTLRFYIVDRPGHGRYAGRTFVNVLASDERHPVRGAGAAEVLAAIALDPRGASVRYGREIGKCGRCGRTLTDETSRANGIGPVCEALGW